jgi:hypothetical protein
LCGRHGTLGIVARFERDGAERCSQLLADRLIRSYTLARTLARARTRTLARTRARTLGRTPPEDHKPNVGSLVLSQCRAVLGRFKDDAQERIAAARRQRCFASLIRPPLGAVGRSPRESREAKEKRP